MKLSNRITNLEFSSIRMLQFLADDALKNGKQIVYMNIGAPDVETPKEFFRAICNHEEPVLGYPNSSGLPQLRTSISEHFAKYGINYDIDEIFITSGATEAIHFSLLATTDVGDSILTANPFYSNYEIIAQITETNIDVFDTFIDNDYAFPSKEEIAKCIHEKTRAFLLCNPSNPTGKLITKEEVDTICELALEHDLFIIADEIYRDYIYDNRSYHSFADNKSILDRLILLDSVSKRYSACGARIGAILSKNKELIDKFSKLCSARVAVPTLEQIGATELYKTDKEFIENVRAEYQARRDLAKSIVDTIPGIQSNSPQGAFYIMLKLPVDDAEEFAKWLLTDFSHNGETLMLTPASGFYKHQNEGKDEIRLVFAFNKKTIERGLNLLRLALEEYNK